MIQIKSKKSKFYYLILILFIFTSCTNKNEKKIIGLWSIEIDSSIVYKRDWRIIENLLIFESNYSCKLPEIFPQKVKDNEGIWKILNQDSIFFIAPNNPLHGKYKFCFYKDYKNQLFKAKFTNDSTVIICSKSIIGFSHNTKDLLDKQ